MNDETNSILSDILRRLEVVENEIAKPPMTAPIHPSREQFAIPEFAENFIPHTKIKLCAFEPNGKPCDDCDLCGARGF